MSATYKYATLPAITLKRPPKLSNEALLSSKILAALNNPKYPSRTVKGIVLETGIKASVVTTLLSHSPELQKHVKVYPRRSTKGEILYTTKDRFYKEAGFLDKFVDLFAK